MATYTTRNVLTKPDYGDAADIAVLNADMDTIDAAIAKSEWAKAAAPTVNDDSADGYAVGSLWFDVSASALYICEDNSAGKAVWDMIYPQGSSAHTAGADPTTSDDDLDGYVIGSMWVNTNTDDIFIAADVTTGKAVWQKVYPQATAAHSAAADPTANDDTLDGYVVGSTWVNTTDDTYFTAVDVTAANAIWKKSLPADGSVALTAAWDAGSYQIRAETFQSDIATISGAPFVVASTTKVTNLNADQLDGLDDTAFVKQTLADAKGDIIVASAADTWARMAGSGFINRAALKYNTYSTNNVEWVPPYANWIPIVATRVSNTSFKVTDTGGSWNLANLFRQGVPVSWTESSTWKLAITTGTGSYASDEVTWNIVGSTMASIDSNSFRLYVGDNHIWYHDWVVPGSLAAGTDVSHTWFTPIAGYPMKCDAFVKTAGTTNATEFDINAGGSTLFNGTAASIASGSTSDIDNAAYTPTTNFATGSAITVDVNSVSTTPPVEAYIRLWYVPYELAVRKDY